MYCPNCDMPRPNDLHTCSECGTPLLPLQTPKKGKLWPPVLFMVVMLALGITLFVLSRIEEPVSETSCFTVEDGVLHFDSRKYTGPSTLIIPTTVDGQTVTSLSAGCFQDCDDLISIELPDTLTSISSYSFSGCESLRGIKLPEGVKKIGNRAFANCPALEAIYVPQSVTAIGKDAFNGCDSLAHIFFVGDSMQWHNLYPDEINPNTEIYTVSGPDAETFSPS